MWNAFHFTQSECTASDYAWRHGLDNTPSPDVLAHLEASARQMDAVRAFLDAPCIISSGYRSPEVNRGVGGVVSSDHVKGYAFDFTCPPRTPLQVCKLIAGTRIKFDQLIQEGNWVHISFNPKMRRQVLTAVRQGVSVTYRAGL